VTVEVLNIALFKLLLKVNVEIFKIVGMQEEEAIFVYNYMKFILDRLHPPLHGPSR